jgi:hypothetical protein
VSKSVLQIGNKIIVSKSRSQDKGPPFPPSILTLGGILLWVICLWSFPWRVPVPEIGS